MPILKAYAFPHPPLAVPAVGRGEEKKIQRTLDAYDRAAVEIAELAPDTVIFITPHNTMYSDYFHISPGNGAKGSLSRFNAPNVRFEVEYDTALSGKIIIFAEKNGLPAGYLGEKDSGLDHGVTVPMWFINRRYQNYKVVRISQSGLAQAAHYRLGQYIAEAAEETGRKAVLIASGDLSHKLPGSSYGTVMEGAEYDGIITKILSSADFLSLFNISESLRERAAECAHNSLIVLTGCFDRRKVDAQLYSYEGPFGVGYAVAGFTPDKPDANRNFLEQYENAILSKARESRNSEDAHRALARASLEYKVKTGETLPLPPGLPDELTANKAGVFVSLHKEGRLRGCIGTIAPTTGSVAEEIIQNSVSAGLSDSRFEPVSASELPWLVYKVDVLSVPEQIDNPGDLDVKRYGVIVSSGYKRGLLLPNLDGIDTVEEQIAVARKKGGIADNAPVKLERFEVIRHE